MKNENWIRDRALDDTFDAEIKERLRRRRSGLYVESIHPHGMVSWNSKREFLEWFEKTFPNDPNLPLWASFEQLPTHTKQNWLMAVPSHAVAAKLRWS